MKREIYKDHYQFEWDHRSHLAAVSNFPIVGITLVGSALTAMALGFPYSRAALTYSFCILITLSAASVILTVIFLFKSILGYEYQRIPTPRKFKEHYDNLLEWHKKYGEVDVGVEADFDEHFYERMADATEVNARNNLRKSAFLHRANISIAVALSLVALTAVPYLISRVNQEIPTYAVKIIEPVKLSSLENVMTERELNQTVPTEKPVEVVPPKPVAPPNQNIKEHVVIPREQKIVNEDGG